MRALLGSRSGIRPERPPSGVPFRLDFNPINSDDGRQQCEDFDHDVDNTF